MGILLDKYKKRAAYPIDLGDGDLGYVRALTFGEIERLNALAKEFKTPFVMGCAMVDNKGQGLFNQPPDQADVDFAAAVRKELADVSTETIAKLSEGIGRIGKAPDQETVLKNLPPTPKPDLPAD